jgi:ATP-dependent metalloprotease FtsH
MKNLAKNIAIILLIFLVISSIFTLFSEPFEEKNEMSLSAVVEKINQEEIKKITVSENDLEIIYHDETKVFSVKEPETALSQSLINYGVGLEKLKMVEIETKEKKDIWTWLLPLLFILPLVVFGFFFWMIFRQAKGGAMQAFDFTKAKARLFGAEGHSKEKITFKDVAGSKEAKEELMEVVDFLKNPKKFLSMGATIPRGVLLMGSPGTGKCITGNSLILTNKGLVEIKDIPKYFGFDSKTNRVYGAKLPTITLKNPEDKINSASHWYDLGEQKTIEITLKQGFGLEGTPEHPIIILNKKGEIKFKSLKELKKNDFVAIKFNTQIFGSSKEVGPENAYLMGLLTGDGNLSHSSRIGLTTTDTEIADFFRTYINNNYEDNIKVGVATDGITQTITSWKVKKDLYSAGMSALLSYDKTIPDTILQAPKATVVAFLQGLFDTDGYFERYNVGYATVSKKLASQVTMLLLNLGIVPRRRIKAKINENHLNPVYEINISGTSLRKFKEEIGFRLSRKQKLLEEYLINHGSSSNTNVDIFPYITNEIINQWTKLSKRRLSNSDFASIIDKIRSRGQISRNSFEKILALFKKCGLKNSTVNRLQSLYNANLFFSPVERIEMKKNRVYDFTVPKCHSFISNGFISHNTLLARAVAGEAYVPFFHISGSEFVEMFVGVGAGRVRNLFLTAKKSAPAIIFIDELDAIGRHRGTGLGGGHDEREQTLNQILVEMDGFERDTKLIVMAATNRPDVLDPALLRPGRFDRRVILDLPDINDREEILKIHCKGKPLAPDINLREIAERTPGFSGADLANLANEAAILAARRNKIQVFQEELFESIEKVLLGPERKSHILSDKEKEITAFHEAGHALVSASLPETEPVRKISIVSRGMAAGYTIKMPSRDRKIKTKSEFLAEMATLLGGYSAEILKFKEITTGASNDLDKASQLARKLVKEYGMSSLGPISFGEKDELVFLGKEFGEQRNYSEKVAALIDEQVENFIKKAEITAKNILTKKKALLEKIAKVLIEKETIERKEFENLMNLSPKKNRAKKQIQPKAKLKIKQI